MKIKITQALVLTLPNLKNPFKVDMDASWYALGTFFMQGGRHLCYHSKILFNGRHLCYHLFLQGGKHLCYQLFFHLCFLLLFILFISSINHSKEIYFLKKNLPSSILTLDIFTSFIGIIYYCCHLLHIQIYYSIYLRGYGGEDLDMPSPLKK